MSRFPVHVAIGSIGALLVSACAGHREVAVAPPPVPVALAPMPALASVGMAIPAVRLDGSYPTPNDGAAGAVAIWHLRGALNVAALSCSGDEGQRVTAAYNAFLGSRRAVLSQAHLQLIAGGTGRDPDSDMTRFYNFYAQLPARAGFCAAADQVAAEISAVPPADLASYAVGALARIDRPFIDFFRDYDAWRMQRPLEVAAVAPAAMVPAAVTPSVVPLAMMDRGAVAIATMPATITAPRAAAAAPPRIEIDAGTLLTH